MDYTKITDLAERTRHHQTAISACAVGSRSVLYDYLTQLQTDCNDSMSHLALEFKPDEAVGVGEVHFLPTVIVKLSDVPRNLHTTASVTPEDPESVLEFIQTTEENWREYLGAKIKFMNYLKSEE